MLKRLKNNNFERPSPTSYTIDISKVGKKPDSSVLEKLSTTISLDEIKKAIQSL